MKIERRIWVSWVLGISLACGHAAFGGTIKSAEEELEQALAKTPNAANGRHVYATCAVCHLPEGWGTPDGTYPQIAGQLPGVIIKQLADFRARNRDNPIMFPFSMPAALGGPQQLADVASYIANLPMNPANAQGSGADLARGEQLYQDNCARCHGAGGEGDAEKYVPRIHGQQYGYLTRQFAWIRSGKRRNANAEMVKQIQGFDSRDEAAVLDYVSRLKPPPEKLATPGWTNPDFANFSRPEAPNTPPDPPLQPPIGK